MNVIYYELQDYGDDFLMHHGIKGMKWGIRRTAEQLGHFTKRVYKTGKAAYNKGKEFREKRIEKAKQKAILDADYNAIMKYKRRMTDEELKHALSRLDTTKKMSDIANARAGEVIERGVKTIETIARVGTAVVGVRKASAEFKKMKATANAEGAKAKKQRLENEQTKRNQFNQTIDNATKEAALQKGREKANDILNDTRNYSSDKERYKAAKRAMDDAMAPFVYKSSSQKAKDAGTKAATQAGRWASSKMHDADTKMYDYIKKRMGRG